MSTSCKLQVGLGSLKVEVKLKLSWSWCKVATALLVTRVCAQATLHQLQLSFNFKSTLVGTEVATLCSCENLNTSYRQNKLILSSLFSSFGHISKLYFCESCSFVDLATFIRSSLIYFNSDPIHDLFNPSFVEKTSICNSKSAQTSSEKELKIRSF